MYILKVTGRYYYKDPSPEATIADMLRYDDGEMISFTESPIEGIKARKYFVAEVHTNNFTPRRWTSFGLKAELVRKEPGKAECNFPDQQSVLDFIHKQSKEFAA